MAAAGQTRLRVLVVENEMWLRIDAEETLLDLGHDVVGWASRARTAIAEARRVRPDFVLMDIQLDGARDGIETARIIRDTYGIPSLFVTGSTDAALQKRAMETQPLGYLQKPIVRSELRSALERFAEAQTADDMPSLGLVRQFNDPAPELPSSVQTLWKGESE